MDNSKRPGYQKLTESAELANVEGVNGILDALYSKKARMANQSKKQLQPLFNNKNFYGRSLRAGASKSTVYKK